MVSQAITYKRSSKNSDLKFFLQILHILQYFVFFHIFYHYIPLVYIPVFIRICLIVVKYQLTVFTMVVAHQSQQQTHL